MLCAVINPIKAQNSGHACLARFPLEEAACQWDLGERQKARRHASPRVTVVVSYVFDQVRGREQTNEKVGRGKGAVRRPMEQTFHWSAHPPPRAHVEVQERIVANGNTCGKESI